MTPRPSRILPRLVPQHAFPHTCIPSCTQVMEYLAALGAVEAADPEAVRVPDITPSQLDMMATVDPMFARPKLDRCSGRLSLRLGGYVELYLFNVVLAARHGGDRESHVCKAQARQVSDQQTSS